MGLEFTLGFWTGLVFADLVMLLVFYFAFLAENQKLKEFLRQKKMLNSWADWEKNNTVAARLKRWLQIRILYRKARRR